jgi:hypothetical protein
MIMPTTRYDTAAMINKRIRTIPTIPGSTPPLAGLGGAGAPGTLKSPITVR